jgi:hypothetical protein
VAGFSDSAPTESQYQELEKLTVDTNQLLSQWERVRSGDITAFQKLAADQNIHSIYVPDAKSERVAGGGAEER